jgi:hypothetical protein
VGNVSLGKPDNVRTLRSAGEAVIWMECRWGDSESDFSVPDDWGYDPKLGRVNGRCRRAFPKTDGTPFFGKMAFPKYAAPPASQATAPAAQTAAPLPALSGQGQQRVQPAPVVSKIQPPLVAATKGKGESAMTCVKIRPNPDPALAKQGGQQFYNGCARTVEIFWCDINEGCKSNSTITRAAGGWWPAGRNIHWGACMGANSGGGWKAGTNYTEFHCDKVD